MPDSEFTIDAVKARFGLTIRDDSTTFAASPPVAAGPLLTETLVEMLPLAVAISTEKARSELVIAPVLLEARRRAGHPVSLFSGVEFPVDAAQGLTGVCDFLLSLSPEQLTVEAPAVAVVEAKNDNLKAGLGQCIAEMVAARLWPDPVFWSRLGESSGHPLFDGGGPFPAARHRAANTAGATYPSELCGRSSL